MIELPAARSVQVNPDQGRLREMALENRERITLTEFGNLNYRADVTSRLGNSTFFVSDEEIHKNRISREEAARVLACTQQANASSASGRGLNHFIRTNTPCAVRRSAADRSSPSPRRD